jgi:formamidopyrimidine-DNA glycosylase
MPELPEVEVIVRELRDKLDGEEIIEVQSLWSKSLVTNRHKLPLGRSIQSIGRHGKFIIFHMDMDFILVHLRMTGRLIVTNGEDLSSQHLRVIFTLKSGKKILFYDARKFGRIYLSDNLEIFFKNFGVDALSPEFSVEKLQDILRNKKGRIKSLFMDQHHIAGLGNIYIDESLFRAGIHPMCAVNKLSRKKIALLHQAIRDTLELAINNMGTTISNYMTSGGGFGNNQFYLKVYGRENEVCYACGSTIRKIRVNSRGTHFCPACQAMK